MNNEKKKEEFFKKMSDEVCQCGHSKGYHVAHEPNSYGMILDSHGGHCEKCDCKIYTWKHFVNYVNIG